jgi:hypothetical protein
MTSGLGLYTEIPSIEILSDTGRDAKIGALGRLVSTPIGSIDVSGGSGYTYADISFVSQGKPLTVFGLTWSISMGMVSNISFSSSVAFREKPNIVITGDGAGASASVVFFQVHSYEIIQQGGNYLTIPQVVIDDTYYYGSTASSIVANLNLFNEGRIDYIRILDGGSGYGTASVSIDLSPYEQNATAEAEITNGVITNIRITNPGHGYVSPVVVINRLNGIGASSTWTEATAIANVDIYSEWVYEEPSGYNVFSKTIDGFKLNVPYEIEILASQDEYFRGFSRYSNNTSFQYYKI